MTVSWGKISFQGIVYTQTQLLINQNIMTEKSSANNISSNDPKTFDQLRQDLIFINYQHSS
jgi:hypothetical protein